MIDAEFWRGRRVLLTGHTGFKGSWASLLLNALGAEVFGLARSPEHADDLFNVAEIEGDVAHAIGDVRHVEDVWAAVANAQPHIVIHMAAQALVRRSYQEPIETYATNVMGTVHVLDALRRSPGVEAVVIVTSDKCYENTGSLAGCREDDRMGGHDPYSNSKGCAELVVDAYRRSYFAGPNFPHVASGRAGNVIGGGDWSQDRLVPDAIRAFRAGALLRIRNPHAIRPWQHVLDPIIGYLVLAQRLARGGMPFAGGWNFGPTAASEVPVEEVVNKLIGFWGGAASWERDSGEHPHEAAYLKLDCTKAATQLGWRPRIGLDDALRLTVQWYRAFDERQNMRSVSIKQIEEVLKHDAVAGAMV